VLSPYRQPTLTAERKKAIQHAICLMGKGLTWGDTYRGSLAMKCTMANDQLRHQCSDLRDRFGAHHALQGAVTL
jgi:hypothetical protein